MKKLSTLLLLGTLLGSILVMAQTGSSLKNRSRLRKPQETVKKSVFSDIQPLLKDRCGKCHGTDGDGELSLLTYDDLMRGGEHGKSVVPGKPDESLLYTKLLEKPPFGKQMPKKGPKLSPEETGAIKKWIADGARK